MGKTRKSDGKGILQRMGIKWVVNSDGINCRKWRGKRELCDYEGVYILLMRWRRNWNGGTMNWGKRAKVQSVLGPDDGMGQVM